MIIIVAALISFSVVAPFTVPGMFREYGWKIGWLIIFAVIVAHVLMWQLFSHERAMVLFFAYELLIMPFAPIWVDCLMDRS